MEGPLWPRLLLQIILIALVAFCTSAETALLSLNENTLRRQAEEGDATAEALLAMVRTPGRTLPALRTGITLAGLLGAAFAADGFAPRITAWLVEERGVTALSPGTLHIVAVVLVTVILAFVTLVLGELVPRRFAAQKEEQVARMACGPLRVLSAVLRPAVWLPDLCAGILLRLMRLDPNAGEDEVSEDEIRMMVDIGEEKGTIEKARRN